MNQLDMLEEIEFLLERCRKDLREAEAEVEGMRQDILHIKERIRHENERDFQHI